MKSQTYRRGVRTFAGVLAALALVPALRGQTHKVAKPENVVRALGVYEWTGDMAKPAASRLIPVSLFIDGKLQDAAVYMARPVPFALLTGNVYELQKAGVPLGTLEMAFARHLVASQTASTSYDDGWFGYGKFVPPAAPKKSTLRASATIPKINALDDDDSKPHFSSRSATPGSGGSAGSTPGSEPTTATPADDPDRPTMKRHPDASDQTASKGSEGSGAPPADDPDRPTLKRHSPEDAKKSNGDQANVTPVANSLNDDPNRPTLHRGKPTSAMNDEDIPKLSGLPVDQDLHQIVAVSDAANRPPHDFARAWDDEAEHQAILTKMQAAARAQLAAYGTGKPAAASAATTPAATTQSKRSSNSKLHRDAVHEKPVAVAEPLLDEQLRGFTLSYGGAATYVYHAHTDGLGAALRYVTIVAQVNMQGEPEIAMKNVTDATHLNQTPRMRLVDAIDAEASNRASLLFELRAQNSRQFALYRVIGARADQIYITGSTQ
jgi:hypothetical protein